MPRSPSLLSLLSPLFFLHHHNPLSSFPLLHCFSSLTHLTSLPILSLSFSLSLSSFFQPSRIFILGASLVDAVGHGPGNTSLTSLPSLLLPLLPSAHFTHYTHPSITSTIINKSNRDRCSLSFSLSPPSCALPGCSSRLLTQHSVLSLVSRQTKTNKKITEFKNTILHFV